MEPAEFTLRPDLCAPEMSAEKLMMIDFAEGWTHLGAGLGGNRFELVCVGVAVPSDGHHGVAPFGSHPRRSDGPPLADPAGL